jgi:serine/threonine protein phosphatase 1
MLLATVKSDVRRDQRNILVFLGDYVDRGPQSKGVLDYLIQFQWDGWEAIFLRGNHDQTVLDFLEDASVYRAWREFGGAETLVSYGVKPPRFDDAAELQEARDEFSRKCPAAHLQFLHTLRHSYTMGDYMFVHAGVRPGVDLDRQSPQDLMWIREEFLLSGRVLDKIIVHGHSPTDRPVRRKNRVGIDTGAYATGQLTAAVLEGTGCRFLSTAQLFTSN